MFVKDARRIAAQWITQEAVHTPGFRGAFSHGSVNWLPGDALFPPASDMDVMIVLDETHKPSPGKFLYDNLLLEVSCLPARDMQSAEQVLSTYYLAGSFARCTIFADTAGYLSSLQRQVAEHYAETKWIALRCRHARDNALRFLDSLKETDPLHDQVTGCLFGAGVLTHILLVAGLKNPTVRHRYPDTRELLNTWQAPDLYEQVLGLAGFGGLTAPDVRNHLDSLTEIFDAASAVIKTPYRFSADISRSARRIAIDGSRELIDAGYHREAMFWITATYCRCRHILSIDAPLEISKRYDAGFHGLLAALEIASFGERERRNERVKKFIPVVWEMAERHFKVKSQK